MLQQLVYLHLTPLNCCVYPLWIDLILITTLLSQQVHEIQTEVNAVRSISSIADELVSLKNLLIESTKNACQQTVQETQLSPRDCAMRCVS